MIVVRVVMTAALSLLALRVEATQPAYINDMTTAPTSAEDIEDPLKRSFAPRAARRVLFTPLRRRLDDLSPFWRDSELNLKPRIYDLDRNREGLADQETFATGAALEYRSGYWRERLALRLTGYTSQKIDGPKDRGGLEMLRPVQTGFGVLGEAYAEIDVDRFGQLRLFRQAMSLPYLNRDDGRMVPNTHEAYFLIQPKARGLRWAGGHVTKIKSRGSERFVPLSEHAGFPGTNKGMTVAGTQWNISEESGVGGLMFHAWDLMNILYGESRTLFEITPELPLLVSLQGTYQSSIGDELGGDFETFTFGSRAAISYKGAVLGIAASYTDDGAAIRSPFGGSPSYLSMMLADFDRAGEAAVLVSASYNFARFRLPGVSVALNFAQGYGEQGDPDRNEFDATLDIRPQGVSALQGAWLRIRAADLNDEGGGDVTDLRVLLNYEFSLF